MARYDTDEREAMIVQNIRLVTFVARKYLSAGIDFDDLFSTGVIGLIKAADHYDEGKGIKFSSFAVRCIENEILMMLRKVNRRSSHPVLSLDALVNMPEKGRGLTLADVIPDEGESVSQGVEMAAEWRRVCKAIGELNERDRELICMRYGLGMYRPHTQAEVAMKLGGVSQSYVSRLEKHAIGKLREALACE